MEKLDFGQESQNLVFRSLQLLPFVEKVEETEKWSPDDRQGIDFKVKFLGSSEVYLVDFTVATQEKILQHKQKMAGYSSHKLVLQGNASDCEFALEQGKLLSERSLAKLARQIFDALGPAWVSRVSEILAQGR